MPSTLPPLTPPSLPIAVGREVCQETNTDHSLIELDDTCLGGIIRVYVGMMKQAKGQVASPEPKVMWPVRRQELTRSGAQPSHWIRLPPADTGAGREAEAAAGTWAGHVRGCRDPGKNHHHSDPPGMVQAP